MSTPEPGWYPDPHPGAPPGSLRWWDGGRWTAHVRPGGLLPAAAPPRRGPTAPDGQSLAGWWWRVLAYVVDSVVILVVGYLATLPVQLELQREIRAQQAQLQERLVRGDNVALGDFWGPLLEAYADHVVVVAVLPIALGGGYFAGFLRWRGATPGKLMCGLRVRRRSEDGPLPWGTIAVRLLVQFGSGWAMVPLALATGSATVFLVGQLVAFLYFVIDVLTAAGGRRQSIHDRVARTVVVATR